MKEVARHALSSILLASARAAYPTTGASPAEAHSPAEPLRYLVDMRMLESTEDEEDDSQVEAVDQERINRFSKLNRRLDDILEDIQTKKEHKEALEDLSTELELEDEDEIVPYQIQSSFLHLTVKEALELTQAKSEKLDAALAALDSEIETCRDAMVALKSQLYGKFGKSINLERGD